ncbi:putative membrane protein [Halobacteriovorax marinus SJ]|uniref:Membrane protein n=1 Tax=Halobacteriovorax marinus (strain ATCC BAA-682 / DSM 15412 / SJ) TaxID=862908 RepID=E1X5H9_HALMS|nr:putative Na+/H+ antiporter [Halobacteriovorax marinus]CBW27300.1 putative membrane protein [Halobacteriovorax marinus SJ]
MNPTNVQLVGTILFVCAVLHTFLVSKFEHLAHKYPKGSMGENIFHFLGEVEAVFGMWAAILIGYMSVTQGLMVFGEDGHTVVGGAIKYLEGLNYTEPAFVFVIMCIAGTRPVILFAEKIILGISKVLPLPGKMAFYVSALVIGPLLGSFITEPAAMTVTALILLQYFYSNEMSHKFKYATLGLLFVNISIGGTLSHFAAPPVLMVAGKWHWGFMHMITHFGYKSTVAILISTAVVVAIFRKELAGSLQVKEAQENALVPTWWMTLTHLIFMGLVVYTAHHMVFFLGLFLFFLGFATITQQYQDAIKLKESLLVGFFLAGLVTLGAQQAWWLQPVLGKMNDIVLFFGATALTAITDNAALTYLGSLVELTDSAKYNLVAGAVAGGGLTVIANAPNPAGFGILKGSFGKEGISPLGLLLGAIGPTLIAMLCLELLPSIIVGSGH